LIAGDRVGDEDRLQLALCSKASNLRVSGAGETFVAALAAALADDMDLVKATRLANIAAGISPSRPGTAMVSGRDLAKELRRRNVIASDDKVMIAEAALRHRRAGRRGLRIGFTNGCFDLIYPGHVHPLAQARAACDRLVVALNTDLSVRHLKGPERPIQCEAARATVMSSLASVSPRGSVRRGHATFAD
jgi:D-beta-D-heptose 7-phosphate kinase/D-beta-D-heptose 1-phosphate adenosyltransferase